MRIKDGWAECEARLRELANDNSEDARFLRQHIYNAQADILHGLESQDFRNGTARAFSTE